MKELIRKWMSFFTDAWPCVYTFVPDIWAFKWKTWVDFSLAFDLDTLHNINQTLPHGMFFFPNWCYWRLNKPGEKALRADSHALKNISAFFIDLDIKWTTWYTMETLLESALEIIKEQNVPVSYITKSWGWYHLWIFVHPDSRTQTWELKRFRELQLEFASLFSDLWADVALTNMWRLIRLPFSNHWKTGKPIQTELYRVDFDWDIELVKVETVDDLVFPEFRCLTFEHVVHYASGIKDVPELVSPETRIMLNLWWMKEVDSVNRIPFETLLFKLQNYPRQLSKVIELDVWWVKRSFDLNDYDMTYQVVRKRFVAIRLIHRTKNTVTLVQTNWYSINLTRNYIHNFTWQNHDNEERPEGQPYAFLLSYFNKDKKRLYEFLEKEFSIKLTKVPQDSLMPSLITANWTINFTKSWVLYDKELIDSKWRLKRQTITLFPTPFIIKGVMESKFTLKWETQTPIRYYIVKRLDRMTDNEFLMEFSETKNKFNQRYWGTWFYFRWSEDDLLDFYVAVNNANDAWQIPNFTLRYLNWWYSDYFLMGNKFITPQFELKDWWENTFLANQPIQHNLLSTQISMSAFLKELRWIFSDRISLIWFFTYILLFLWNNFWESMRWYKQQFMMPALVCSGRTQAGKTTFLAIMKEWSWLDPEARKLSMQKTTTLQPMKQAATDSFILHFDEFTWDILPDREAIIRDIINKAQTARWLQSGENVTYTYRSSLIVDWERLPASESVVNRCIVLPFFEEDKIGNEQKLMSIRWKSFLKDLIQKAYSIDKHEIVDYFIQAEDILEEIWFSWRAKMLNAYMVAINIMFDICPMSNLIEAIKANSNVLWEVKWWQDMLASLLADLIVTKRITPHINTSAMDESTLEIPITTPVLMEKQIDIAWCIKQYRWSVSMSNHKLTIKFKPWDWIADRISQFAPYFRTSHLF